MRQSRKTHTKDYRTQSDNFLKKGAAVSDADVQAFQGKLMEQKQQIDTRKQMLSQKLNEKSFGIMEDIKKTTEGIPG